MTGKSRFVPKGKIAVSAAVFAALALTLLAPSPAQAWWARVGGGWVWRPAGVVVPPRLVVGPPVIYAPPPVAYAPPPVVVAPYPRRWVPAHYDWRGAWVPGHWA